MIARIVVATLFFVMTSLPTLGADWWRDSESPATTSTPVDQKVVSETTHDAYRINWVDEYIEVMAGATVDDKRAVNQAHAVSMAKKTARHLAYEKLAETIAGIRLEGDATYDKQLMRDANLKTSVQAFIRGAVVVSEKVSNYPDGSVWAEVVLGVHLNGDKGLGGPTSRWVSGRQSEGRYFTDDDATQAESGPDTAEEAVVRMEEAVAEAEQSLLDRADDRVKADREAKIRQLRAEADRALKNENIAGAKAKVQQIRAMVFEPPAPKVEQTLTFEHLTSPDYRARFTGLVVDARGLGASPAVLPRLVTAGGKILYGPESVNAKTMGKIGLVGYAPGFDEAKTLKRVGKKPLVIRAIGVENGSDLVISTETAALVHATTKQKKLFKKCAVVLVLN